MAKRRLGLITLLLCFCLCLLPCSALAASTADAKEPIVTDKECSLSIYYGYEGTAFADQGVQLYKVADVSADCQYTLTAPFAASNLIINGIKSNNEWNVVRSTLEAWLLDGSIVPVKTATTNDAGQAHFTQLTPGLYLASSITITQDGLTCVFASALVALPGLDADGYWQYQVSVSAKPEILEPEEEIELKVLKLWKGDEDQNTRPKSIDVEIFCNGESYENVVLSEENNWSYSWKAKNDGSNWKVMEWFVPKGYAMTVEQKENTFIITNSLQDPPAPEPPKTGDTANIMLYAVLMLVSGTMLILLGIAGKRQRHEETN